jgi:predicted P-loop ATPase
LQRYASFIGTSNQKDLLTDPSGSRRFICIEVTGNIDTTQPIDYEQLYAQAIHEIYHGERYWFDSEDEQIMPPEVLHPLRVRGEVERRRIGALARDPADVGIRQVTEC